MNINYNLIYENVDKMVNDKLKDFENNRNKLYNNHQIIKAEKKEENKKDKKDEKKDVKKEEKVEYKGRTLLELLENILQY